MPTRTLAALPLALSVLGLSACSLFGEPTVTASEVAEAAEDALEEQVGSRPDIDCGDDDAIPVVEGDTVDCVLTDPSNGAEYDATVTFSSVDGDTWNADVQVAEEPNGAPEEPSEPADETSSEAPAGDELTITAERLAAATADALEGQVGSRPDIDCGAPDLNITIYVGRTYYCDLIDPDSGAEYGVSLDITKIEGEQFEFDIKVDENPR